MWAVGWLFETSGGVVDHCVHPLTPHAPIAEIFMATSLDGITHSAKWYARPYILHFVDSALGCRRGALWGRGSRHEMANFIESGGQ